MGEIVLPINRHWMMWAIIKRFRAINAAARHRPVFDLRMPVGPYPEALKPSLARPEVATTALASRLTQPLFTKLANLLQNRRYR